MTALAFAALAAWAAVLLLPWQPHRIRERLEPGGAEVPLYDVTVLIPARNEACVITRTLAALARQGAGLEVIVVDDESEDGTADRVRAFASDAAAKAHPAAIEAAAGPGESTLGSVFPPPAQTAWPVTVEVVGGRMAPPGWSGKLWALQQGLAAIRRPRVLLLDADIELAPGMLAALLGHAEKSGAHLVSIMATLRSETFAEKLLAPPFVFFFKLIYPFALANSVHRRVAAAAGGCMLVSTDTLRRNGGFEPLRGALIDDCTLAATLKRRGYRTWIGMSRSVRSLRAYTFGNFWRMVSRTAFTQLGYSPLLLAGTAAAMLVVFVAPVAALFSASSALVRTAGGAALIAMAAAYWPILRFYRLPAWWVATLPAAAVLFLGMTIDSALGYWRGVRAEWKGRRYRAAE